MGSTSLLGNDSVTKEYVLEQVDIVKQRLKEDENQLRKLLETRGSESQRLCIPQKLTEVADALKASLSEEMSLAERRLVLEAVQTKVEAVPNEYQFTCFIDAELASEEDDTWEATFKEELEQFERVHSELTFGDLVDRSRIVPEDTALGRMTNQVKKQDLVTIVRTSG